MNQRQYSNNYSNLQNDNMQGNYQQDNNQYQVINHYEAQLFTSDDEILSYIASKLDLKDIPQPDAKILWSEYGGFLWFGKNKLESKVNELLDSLNSISKKVISTSYDIIKYQKAKEKSVKMQNQFNQFYQYAGQIGISKEEISSNQKRSYAKSDINQLFQKYPNIERLNLPYETKCQLVINEHEKYIAAAKLTQFKASNQMEVLDFITQDQNELSNDISFLSNQVQKLDKIIEEIKNLSIETKVHRGQILSLIINRYNIPDLNDGVLNRNQNQNNQEHPQQQQQRITNSNFVQNIQSSFDAVDKKTDCYIREAKSMTNKERIAILNKHCNDTKKPPIYDAVKYVLECEKSNTLYNSYRR